jgi:hypothetical protein
MPQLRHIQQKEDFRDQRKEKRLAPESIMRFAVYAQSAMHLFASCLQSWRLDRKKRVKKAQRTCFFALSIPTAPICAFIHRKRVYDD